MFSSVSKLTNILARNISYTHPHECRVNKRILLKILSPLQNFVAATCCTKTNWFNFVRHVAATKFCRGDKILINQASNIEAFTPGDLSLQPIAAMSACDLPFDCTRKAICCSNVLQRFVASCVPAFNDILASLDLWVELYFTTILKLLHELQGWR